MMEMKDVPSRIWREVRDKWEGILANGKWHAGIWHTCTLCGWMAYCADCPLRTDSWCMAYGNISRLHARYHDYDVDTWLGGVEKFIEEISQYCEDEEDGQTRNSV